MNALELKKLAEKTDQDVSFSVLDLPIEKQKRIAKLEGFGENLQAWREHTKKQFKETQEFLADVEYIHFDTIEEAKAAGYTVPRWHNETINARLVKD